jgi:hypothetical protein
VVCARKFTGHENNAFALPEEAGHPFGVIAFGSNYMWRIDGHCERER